MSHGLKPSQGDNYGGGPIPIGRHLVEVGKIATGWSRAGNPKWDIMVSGVTAGGRLKDPASLDKAASMVQALGYTDEYLQQNNIPEILPEHVAERGFQLVIDVQEEPSLKDPSRWVHTILAYHPKDTPTTPPDQIKAPVRRREEAAPAQTTATAPATPPPPPGQPSLPAVANPAPAAPPPPAQPVAATTPAGAPVATQAPPAGFPPPPPGQ